MAVRQEVVDDLLNDAICSYLEWTLTQYKTET